MTDVTQAANDVPAMKGETIDDLEKQLGELVRVSNMTPDRVAAAISNHAKAVIRSATAQSRQGLSDLFTEMQNVDSFLADKERQLCAEADALMTMASEARKAADAVRLTLKNWNAPKLTNGGA